MNKYEKALEELSFPLMSSDCGGCKCGESDCSCEKREAVETLQELVDKATPKKLLYNGEYVSFCNCPNCKKVVPVHGNYCPRCGQALDWRVENGNVL